MQKYKNRSEVPEKYKWDLTEFYKNEQEFDKSYQESEKKVEELKKYQGCTKDAKLLYEYLQKDVETVAELQGLYCYANSISDQDVDKPEGIARKNRVINLNSKYDTNTSFFASELLELSKEEYQQLYEDNKKLEEFKSDLDAVYRRKEHTLTGSEEKVISELINSMNHYGDMSSVLLNSEHDYGTVTLEDGEEVVIANNNYGNLLRNKDESIRKKVYTSFNNKLKQYSTTSASLLNCYVNMNQTNSKLHNYKSAWDQKLFNLRLSDNVFKSLVDTTESKMSSLHKYYQLRKKVLKKDVLYPYDLGLDMSDGKKEYTIEEAQQLVLNAIKPLGEDYYNKFKNIIDNRNIDYCQYKGKCSGAYSISTLTYNPRILMSYNGSLASVSTIAHEGGHHVNHQYINEANPLQYRSSYNIVAEVASLTNECLLSNYIVNNGSTNDEKLSGLENIIEVIVSNLFGAVREGKNEQIMYEHVLNGGSITNDYMNKISMDSFKLYYGDEIKIDDLVTTDWIRRSHYYMNFYLYSYAICISVACNVASKILNNDQEMLNKYLDFLKVGSDKTPKEAFDVLGIDLEDKKVYENAISYFDSLVEKYNEIFNEK